MTVGYVDTPEEQKARRDALLAELAEYDRYRRGPQPPKRQWRTAPTVAADTVRCGNCGSNRFEVAA